MTSGSDVAARRNGARVTVVGSRHAFFEAVTMALELDGHEVTCLVVGADVASRIIQTRPDLICIEDGGTLRDRAAEHDQWSADEPELVAIPIVSLDNAVAFPIGDGVGGGEVTPLERRPPGIDQLLLTVRELLSRD